MADEIYIDPATFDTAAAGIEKAQADLQGAFDNFTAVLFTAVLGNLGDFLGNDDAGTQLKADYNPASENFRTGIQKLLDEDLPAFATSLRNDGQSWRNADTALFGE
jgi:hypothetical protein